MVKPNAPELLRKELTAPKWEPQPLAMSGATDCYQPVEKQLQITRGCLEVLAAVLNPVTVVTKNHLVTRDLDHLQRLAHYRASAVMLSITTLDSKLAARLEPRASSPSFRLQAIRELNEAGVPAGVSVAPVIPGLNEHEIPAILEAAADHGAAFAVYSIVRLPRQMPELFAAWLHRHFPDRADRVLGRIRQIRGGELDDSRFRSRMTGEGKLAEEIGTLFRVSARRMGLSDRRLTLSTDFFCHGGPTQLQLF